MELENPKFDSFLASMLLVRSAFKLCPFFKQGHNKNQGNETCVKTNEC